MLRNRGFARAAAMAASVCALIVATPQTAAAKVDNLWSIWASEVTDRSMVEVPFVILTSLPAMLISTPFWFGVWSVDKLKGEDAEADDTVDEFADEKWSEAADSEAAAEGEATGEDAAEGESEAGEAKPAEDEAIGTDAAEGDGAEADAEAKPVE